MGAVLFLRVQALIASLAVSNLSNEALMEALEILRW